jgi:aspartyl-tRNA synthetase
MTATSMRTHRCGALRAAHVGQEVRLGGWVHRRRDLGGIIFLDLRDREGIVQVAFGPEWTPKPVMEAAAAVGTEDVVLVHGLVTARPSGQANAEMVTGAVEVRGKHLDRTGPARPPAIPVWRAKGEALPAEELRLRHRHIDLRRPEMQHNLLLRHRLFQRARATLSELGFLEIETPILTKPTPEGARDYLVPSRVHHGQFYALPQSPQIYKQVLMVAGFDRYFQIARCFRDEDPRADRQPEFTQIDIEASFVSQDDVQRVVEAVIVGQWAEAGHTIPAPFLRMTHADAMRRFGTDKPDLRYALEIEDLSSKARPPEEFAATYQGLGGQVRGLKVPGGAVLSRKDLDELSEAAKRAGKGAAPYYIKRKGDEYSGPGGKLFGDNVKALGIGDGDILFTVVGKDDTMSVQLGQIRRDVVRKLKLPVLKEHALCWVVDFPLFEQEDDGSWTFSHHPFTSPHPDDRARVLAGEKAGLRALHYDAVYNGNELGSGSIRITDPAVQLKVFESLGISETEAQQRFGFLLDALRSGAPPHGGFAIGFDRVAMFLAGGESLRDVIAFPKSTTARALFEDTPAAVPQQDLDALGVSINTPRP